MAPTAPPTAVPATRPAPPPIAAPRGTERPKVKSAGTMPTAAPRALPAARPVAPPPTPKATAPLAAEAAETWNFLSVAMAHAPAVSSEAFVCASAAASVARPTARFLALSHLSAALLAKALVALQVLVATSEAPSTAQVIIPLFLRSLYTTRSIPCTAAAWPNARAVASWVVRNAPVRWLPTCSTAAAALHCAKLMVPATFAYTVTLAAPSTPTARLPAAPKSLLVLAHNDNVGKLATALASLPFAAAESFASVASRGAPSGLKHLATSSSTARPAVIASWSRELRSTLAGGWLWPPLCRPPLTPGKASSTRRGWPVIVLGARVGLRKQVAVAAALKGS
mmetsp:Transcript_129771/g.361551  ORF Transcript_129771/g.361551 Transcript_129771/m.361551 type:complete len:339 (+) Transcript_129771:427-1443(+)